MKILVLTGSPRKNGNSATLADSFIKGAKEAGHTVERFDAAFKKVHPCIACNSCGMDGPCVFKDDFEFVRRHIITAADTNKDMMSATLEGLRGFMRDCMEGSVERGVLYGPGAYEKGEVRNLPVFREAYEAGQSC